jgi:hypothetical protein
MLSEKKEGMPLTDNTFMRVEEVAQVLGVSVSYAYKIIQKLNAEMKEMDYLTISGRINRNYFMERFQYDGRKGE